MKLFPAAAKENHASTIVLIDNVQICLREAVLVLKD
jgi:hypothetical protein